MTMKNDIILQNDDEGIDGMLPVMPSSSGISSFLAVAFGGGTNSTAMLCGFRERGIIPDLILFADTGGEMPYTYEHVLEMDAQCRLWWGIGIETVRKTYQGGFEGLEKNCLRMNMLPSLAYGKRGCSIKYKGEVQDGRLVKELRARGIPFQQAPSKIRSNGGKAISEWLAANGKSVNDAPAIKAIGFDAGESHRSANEMGSRPDIQKPWYALIEWGWRRQECIEAIARHGLTQPGKSSCFFCPAMKRGEILQLKKNHPEYFARALAIEKGAVLRSPGRGLGGQTLRWENVDSNDDAQGKLWNYLDETDESPIPCGCYDG